MADPIPPWFLQRWFATALLPTYAGVWDQPPGWRTRRAPRQEHNLVAVLHGGMRIEIGGRTLDLGPGEALVVPPGMPFADGDGPGRRGTGLLSAGVVCACQGGVDPLRSLGPPAVVRLRDPRALARRAQRLAALWRGDPPRWRSPGDHLSARGIIDRLLAAWIADGFAAQAFAPPSAELPEWLWRALDLMETRLPYRQAVEGIAAAVGRSPGTLSRAFKAHLGTSPKQWLLERRIERAAWLLVAEPELALDAVAGRCGLGDGFQLSRLFRARRGVPPGRWRREHAPSRIRQSQ
jgi:AraC-like DNA-binding protein